MAKFTFTLAGVLRHREFVERERQRDLAVVQAELAGVQAELRALDESVKASTAELRTNHLTGPIDLAYLTAHRRYTTAMGRKALEVAQRVAVAQKKVDDAQRVLAEAAKQRKILEKLRERRLEQWKADQAKKETDAGDEAGMQLSYANLTATADNEGE
ncbi:MAG TPA: flagellar export protein FliJ [Tepidisphaeraceae bacterium]|nr:flagellar export protein FliJ [Tepidisphaeraceae bacterium]